MIILLLLVLVLPLFLFLIIQRLQFWKKRDVRTGTILSTLKNNINMLLGRESFGGIMEKMYNQVDGVRYLGDFQFQTPVLVLKSPELIKQIGVKDFDHFLDRRSVFPENSDQLMSKNLLSLKGRIWKEMRSKLSPSFTSSKMRLMYTLISHNANLFAQHFLKKNEDVVKIEMKDAFSRYANDVIASAAFGIQVDSLEERSNEFFIMAKKATNFASVWKKLRFFILMITPSLASFFRISFLSWDEQNFFIKIVNDAIKIRKERNIVRPDMLGLLLEARKAKNVEKCITEPEDRSFAVVEEHLKLESVKQDLTDMDIAAQLFVFFLAGFEAVSSLMCFMAYELAVNPDVQRRLIEEIDKNKPENGLPSYETIMNMTYLDMVVSETLRRWPNAVGTDRTVTKPYTIEPELPDEKPVHLDRGDIVVIPFIAIHYDPKYYTNPKKFDPERFSADQRKNIDPYTYLPFGIGPRNCIGSRFALLETKSIFFALLSNFEIIPVEETNIPLIINKSTINLTSVNGFPLALKRRF